MDDVIGGACAVVAWLVAAYYIWKYGAYGAFERVKADVDAVVRRIAYGPKPVKQNTWIPKDVLSEPACRHPKTEPIESGPMLIGHMCTSCYEVLNSPRPRPKPMPPISDQFKQSCRHPDTEVHRRMDGSADLFCPRCGTSGWVPYKAHPFLGDVTFPGTSRSEKR